MILKGGRTMIEYYPISYEKNYLYVAGFEQETMVDGPGIRFGIFLQGCYRHCKGCHNQETWSTDKDILDKCKISFDDILDKINKSKLITGLTFSGGEPILQSAGIVEFIEYIKEKTNKNFDIMFFTGYTKDELEELSVVDINIKKLLELSDRFIDGPFIEEEKSQSKKFRGSLNQMYWIKNKDQFVNGDE